MSGFHQKVLNSADFLMANSFAISSFLHNFAPTKQEKYEIKKMAKKKQKKQQQTGQHFLSPEQYMKQRARSLEIGACYVSDDMTECSEGHVFVTRHCVA